MIEKRYWQVRRFLTTVLAKPTVRAERDVPDATAGAAPPPVP
jgi:hypothetical protein